MGLHSESVQPPWLASQIETHCFLRNFAQVLASTLEQDVVLPDAEYLSQLLINRIGFVKEGFDLTGFCFKFCTKY